MLTEPKQATPDQSKKADSAASMAAIHPLFTSLPNKLLPRVILHPEGPEERAWRFLSNVDRAGQNSIDEYPAASSNDGMDSNLRRTLEGSGAFKIPKDNKKNHQSIFEDSVEEPVSTSVQFRATATPFYPQDSRCCMAYGQVTTPTRVHRAPLWRVERVQRVQRVPPREADLSQFVVVKRQKRRSQGHGD